MILQCSTNKTVNPHPWITSVVLFEAWKRYKIFSCNRIDSWCIGCADHGLCFCITYGIYPISLYDYALNIMIVFLKFIHTSHNFLPNIISVNSQRCFMINLRCLFSKYIMSTDIGPCRKVCPFCDALLLLQARYDSVHSGLWV